MYAYKPVYPRLTAKVRRAFVRAGNADRQLRRTALKAGAAALNGALNGQPPSAIITSPPYMNSLSYARDNRLRLWFLGTEDHRDLEGLLSPRKRAFLQLMEALLPKWAEVLPKGAPCVLVLGAVRRDGASHDLPNEVKALTERLDCRFEVTLLCRNAIPDNRRARVNCRSTREETIMVLRKKG